MAGGAKLVVDIVTDASKASKGIDDAANKFGKFGTTMENLAAPAAGVLAGVTVLAAGTIDAASDMQQAMGGVDAVFGESASQVKKWASEASASVGLSAAEYASFASTVGAQLKNLGVPMEDVAGSTDGLIQLGADLAATYGGTTAEAVSALSSALRGEADPAERYGLALNQTAVNAELAANGMGDLEGEALTAAKAQAIMSLATEQAGGAVGQFGREADTVAGQQQRMAAETKDAAAALGESLLPIISPIVGALADMAGWIKQNASWIMPLVGVVASLAAAIVVANAAMRAWSTIQAVARGVSIAYTAVQHALNAAMAANPIGLVVLAIVALVAAFIWLWNNVEGFRNFFIGVWDAIQVAMAAVTDWFTATWDAVVSWFEGVWKSVAGFLGGIWQGIKSAIGKVAGFFKTVWNVVVKAVTLYFRLWWAVISGIIAVIRKVVGAVTAWFRAVWNTVVQLVVGYFRSWWNFISAVISGIRRVIGNITAWFKSVWASVVTGVIGFFRNWWNFIKGVIGGIRSVVSSVANFFRSAWEGAIRGVTNILGVLRSVFVNVFNAVMTPINAVINAFRTMVGWIQDIISWLGRIKVPDVLGAVGDIFGRFAGQFTVTAPAAPAAASARLAPGVGAQAVTGGAPTYNITVNGGLDSADTIARRVEAVLKGRDRRTGGIKINRVAVP